MTNAEKVKRWQFNNPDKFEECKRKWRTSNPGKHKEYIAR